MQFKRDVEARRAFRVKRYFFSKHPIAVPPIGIAAFFGEGLAGHEERVSLDLAAGYGPDCTRARA
jgi:hypothetical protein